MIHIWSDMIEWHQNISVVKPIIKLFKEPQCPLTHPLLANWNYYMQSTFFHTLHDLQSCSEGSCFICSKQKTLFCLL